VCQRLQAMIEGKIKDLLINIPPGFAKSMICAVFMPAWVWINDPGYRFLFSSYKADYAIRDSKAPLHAPFGLREWAWINSIHSSRSAGPICVSPPCVISSP